MKIKVFPISAVGVLIILFIALTVLPDLQAQINKPRQLRKEMLQPVKPHAKPTKKSNKPNKKRSNLYEPPPVGTTVFKPVSPMQDKSAKLVYIQNSDELYFDQLLRPDIQLLKGHVVFRHDNALLYCDSAYFSELYNSFDAFGNIKIVQADTLFVYGDLLKYDGNTKLARILHNVRMVNRNTTLTTDSLNYDRASNLAYYYTGGKIVDDVNTLTSRWGQYSPATKEALFKTDVVLENPNFTLTSDTLQYNTGTKIANILSDTHGVYKKETDIYSTRGWYNTSNDRMMLLNRSFVEHNDGKTMVGDTIFYDKKNKYAEAYSNVELNDNKKKTTLYGNYVSYDETKETGLATDSALLVDWSDIKDSLFLSADTLYSMKDSTFDVVRAYKNVRFLRNDFQGMSDSLMYSGRDSIMHLNSAPVLWSDNNQLMGGRITAYSKNKKVEKIHVEQSAMVVQKDSSIYYNQIAGKEMTAWLDSNQIKKVYVNGNAETIYFPRDEKTKEIVGVNKTVSSYVTMYLKNKKIDRIILTTASSGTMYPLFKMGENDLYLSNFYWYEKERPVKMEDVFSKFARTAPPKRPESEKKPAFPSESSSTPQNINKNPNSSGKRSTNPNSSTGNAGRSSNPLNSLGRQGKIKF